MLINLGKEKINLKDISYYSIKKPNLVELEELIKQRFGNYDNQLTSRKMMDLSDQMHYCRGYTYVKLEIEYNKLKEKVNLYKSFLKNCEKDALVLWIKCFNCIKYKVFFHDNCEFDIFDKEKEIDNAFKFYEKREELFRSERDSYIDKITSEFYKQNLLSSSTLSNSEKYKTYTDLRNFCCKYIPALAERDFKIDFLLRDYPEFFFEDSCNRFKENWNRLSRSYSVLSRGISGEEKVSVVLHLFDDRIRILSDYVWGHEHDFIVITPYGISTIEVKNLYGNYLLTETGILKCLSSDKVKPKDVALQSKKHLETLRRNLMGCPAFSENVPLQEIICSAESNFTIKDEYHYITICYYNTLDKFLFPESRDPVLNEKSMDEIEKYLLDNKKEPFKFDVFLPRGEIDSRTDFIKSFAEVASGYIAAKPLIE